MKGINLDQPPKHCWPRSLLEIAELLGDEAALLLWQAYPGVHVHVPKAISADHPLAQVLGIEVAAKLAAARGGENLQVPRVFKGLLMIRNFNIRRERRKGAQHRELALKHKLSERQIIAICTADGLVKDSRQADLFAED